MGDDNYHYSILFLNMKDNNKTNNNNYIDY